MYVRLRSLMLSWLKTEVAGKYFKMEAEPDETNKETRMAKAECRRVGKSKPKTRHGGKDS